MTGSALATIQRQFLARIRGETDGLPAAIAPGRLSGDVGIGIYVHAYGARLTEALDNDHPVLGSYLGDKLWAAMCLGYVAAHPSSWRSLRDFGAALPGYLARVQPFQAHPEIAELAAFERQLLDTFDAPDEEHLEWAQLLAIPEAGWPALRLRFHPSLGLHSVVRNCVEIWRAVKDGEPPPVAGAAKADWVLWRDAERVTRFRSIGAEERAAVTHTMQRGDFGGLCALLLRWRPDHEVPATALGYLQAWCAEGWLSGADLPSPPGIRQPRPRLLTSGTRRSSISRSAR